MGAGASAANCSPQGISHGGQDSSQSGRVASTTHLDVVEGGVNWLACAIEAEKKEKEWLANKYDAKCEEVNSLQKEIRQLRQELDEARRGLPAPSTAASSAPAVAPSLMLSPATRVSNPSSPLSPSSQEANVGSPGSPNGGAGGGGLMGRRGLKLCNVNTPQRRAQVSTTPASLRECSPTPISPVKEETHKDTQPEEELPIEPMSALLRRRSEDWSGAASRKLTSSMSLGPAGTPGSSMQLGPLGGNANGQAGGGQAGGGLAIGGDASPKLKNLHVAAEKVYDMLGEEDGPCSPKRILKSRKKGGVQVGKRDTFDGEVGLAAGSGGTA